MPELPEVETIRRDLVDFIKGKKIKSVIINNKKTVRNKAAFFVSYLTNRKILDIDRRGKLLIIALEKKDDEKEGQFLLVHLKMTGQLIFVQGRKSVAGGHSLSEGSFLKAIGGALPNKHTRVIFVFAANAFLYFNDLRLFGYLEIVSRKRMEEIKAKNYGPEPLSPDLTISYLKTLLKNRTSSIKAILLNQKLVAGLGNIYVDESLFLAGIKPQRVGKSLKTKEIEKLIKSINKVIAKAIDNRGTTFNNYVDSQGKKGNFTRLLKVYGRQGAICLRCGKVIEKCRLAGRGTHYCPNCQK
ncbi:MAG: bifunctional DNA-formamidopyrimidine glycosylase/DNA-(apurinic or apyrimidinic site) lyase [Patescibacteria group bacterium]|jgi:formamidopyrimidine-DNA glycosylase|nr:bifunctional DNA-formamidopyrimidine glycosylase/DNA-(apurinic or apyrimidinic site) lyase [Patescibacteria group bacterium]MDD3777834.1 bifunctional DNA-formamidopyrimidine glycosylase/DNA-(apurinic or apyrimidinic site) lyase [Patescibacteria group bacterium]MDD3939334.1 bifunctional DNA-formamidopyrimidine glycosylase/DNA-(apurinic or apyrimidinic site) lyase [Patescibacteria group bacterium]MDD4443973.1 bifunctional DNA-formamidopyrimidine glycosylase/DNA-(apurinic or apyrimidinic site) l